MKEHKHEYGFPHQTCIHCGRPETVTKEWLAWRLTYENKSKVIGRALLAIYNRQTLQEQVNAATINRNGIGFSKPDSRVGSIGARMFKKRGDIQNWVTEIWMRNAKDGLPRICKYAGQLEEISKNQHEYAT